MVSHASDPNPYKGRLIKLNNYLHYVQHTCKILCESVALQEDIDAEVVTPREFMINKL